MISFRLDFAPQLGSNPHMAHYQFVAMFRLPNGCGQTKRSLVKESLTKQSNILLMKNSQRKPSHEYRISNSTTCIVIVISTATMLHH